VFQRTRTLALPADWSLPALAQAGRGSRGERVLFDGRGGESDGWKRPGLVGLAPRCLLRVDGRDERAVEAALARIRSELVARRAPDLDGATGLAILLGYECLSPGPGYRTAESFPSLLAFSVDRTVVLDAGGPARLTVCANSTAAADADLIDWSQRLQQPPARATGTSPTLVAQAVATSLPRDCYIEAVVRLQRWIAEGPIYQANLCQRFDATWCGDPLDYFERVVADQTVPRSAFLSIDDLCLASFSPETFVTVDDGVIETLPIKGTRPRGATAEQDRAAIDDLLASPKDRAELLMIVDLERNDIGRICRPGTVEVPELWGLQSYPAVHHLVARVRGRLRDGVSWDEIVRAMFPGGSITGAPKKSAMDRLRLVEPVARGPFTGSLFWCGDDGSIDSSILIRTAVFAGEHVSIGAGGGIVADSNPEAEWAESNHKARALTRALGFDPEDVA
jgi:anthranilate/para-aminobenzoate synthase component I